MSNGEFAFLHFSWKQNGWKCRVSAAVRELLKRPGVELAGRGAVAGFAGRESERSLGGGVGLLVNWVGANVRAGEFAGQQLESRALD
ncbi:MAG: hypothetical protein ACI8TQ_002499 [Planctomycetota bacterium]|jgi:hypothetical protein